MIKMDFNKSSMQLEGYFELLFREFYEIFIALKEENVFTDTYLRTLLKDEKALKILSKSGKEAHEDLQNDMNYFAELLTIGYCATTGKNLEDFSLEELQKKHDEIIGLMNGGIRNVENKWK